MKSTLLWFFMGMMSTVPIYMVFQVTCSKQFEDQIAQINHDLTKHTTKVETESAKNDLALPTSFIRFAKKLNKKGQILILAVFNNGHALMAHSWLCNTIYMGIHHQVLLVVADTKTRDHLRRHWPHVRIEALPGKGATKGDLEYRSIGYVRLTVWRNFILHEFLKAQTELLLVEMDALWLRNPLPLTKRLTESFDISGINVDSIHIGFGYMYIKPTAAILKVWQNFTDTFVQAVNKFQNEDGDLKTENTLNDQFFLSDLLNAHYAGVWLKKLPRKYFPDGRWYKQADQTILQKAFVLNNNFIVGNKAKIDLNALVIGFGKKTLKSVIYSR